MVLSVALTLALAAPPVPTLISPIDGGWASRRPDLEFTLPFGTSPETVGVQLQVVDDLGADAGFLFVPRDGIGTQSFTGPPMPDASFYGWRGRGLDDAGLVSVWSSSGAFRVDDTPPPAPAFFTADLDAGVLVMTCGATNDTQSGLAYYHFGLSRLDSLDGSINFNGTVNLQPTAPTTTVLLGPGSYFAAVHAHDLVGNAAQSLFSPLLVVAANGALPTPQPPEVIRVDGGAWATLPYLPVDVVRFRVDAGGIASVVGFSLSRKGRTETEWELCDYGAGPTIVQTLPAGDQDVRVAVLSTNGVSDWSAPLRLFIDESAPNTPNVTASVDAGAVTLRWPSTRDNFQGSGLLEYRVQRCCVADAAVTFPSVAHVPDASITFTDSPGFGAWSYSVTALDRAGNAGTPWQGAVPLLPDSPRGLRATPSVTNQPVTLEWDDDRDGGFAQLWAITRLDANDAGLELAPGHAAPSFTDPAPEGVWSYEVTAVVGTLRSAPARLDGVTRDNTPPSVGAPQVNRLGARTAEVSFSALDALSGVASVRLERDGVDLGPVTSPFTDTPPQDGTHRYRAIATDRAGNTATGADSPDFVTPGSGIVITPVEPGPHVRRGVRADADGLGAGHLVLGEPARRRVPRRFARPVDVDPDGRRRGEPHRAGPRAGREQHRPA